MNFKRFTLNLVHLGAVDSTNNYAANLIKESNVANGTTIMTKRQRFGKGQRGNSWHTESGKNLTVSTIIFPNLKNESVFYLNIAVSLAVEKTLRDLGVDAKVKWPNDIYVGNQKIGGILIENQIQGKQIKNSIIGLGLNVNQVDFPNGMNAISIVNILKKEVETEDIFLQYFGYLDFYIDHLMNSNFNLLRSRYYEILFQKDELCRYKDKVGEFEGRITGIDQNGKLMIHTSKGNRTYSLQEVKFIV